MGHDHDQKETWTDAQNEEQAWWGDCANTYWEETKQIQYAKLMNLNFEYDEHGPYFLNIGNKSILDIGGGPSSLLLKASRKTRRTVADPCAYPQWVYDRYALHGIEVWKLKGEDVDKLVSHGQPLYDEVWMYNVLQHTEDPERILTNALKALRTGGKFRFFDWINTPVNTAHPHQFTEEYLGETLKDIGFTPITTQVLTMKEHGCYGESFSGVFTK